MPPKNFDEYDPFAAIPMRLMRTSLLPSSVELEPVAQESPPHTFAEQLHDRCEVKVSEHMEHEAFMQWIDNGQGLSFEEYWSSETRHE
jgi:hypothetical protein